MTHKEIFGETIRESFNKFHKNNPGVYEKFENMALEAIRKGRKRLSAKLIVNVLRWEYYIRTDDENFKINDSFHSYYARLFAEMHPEYKDRFEFRKLRNEEPAPYMEIDENGQISFL